MPFSALVNMPLRPGKSPSPGCTCRRVFQVIGPFGAKPVFLDDTCNYLSFEDEDSARLVAGVLNSAPCQQFLQSLIFSGSKRPITIELLQRLNLNAIAEKAGFGPDWQNLPRVNYKSAASAPQFELVMESTKPDRCADHVKSVPVSYAHVRGRGKKPPKSTTNHPVGT